MSTPARGPQPVQLADGSTAYSSGAAHTLWIRLADRLKPRSVHTDQQPTRDPYRAAYDAANTGR